MKECHISVSGYWMWRMLLVQILFYLCVFNYREPLFMKLYSLRKWENCNSSKILMVFDSGMNKMVINHLDKLFVTNDAATIVSELEVQHPAAKILVLAGKAQQEEIGDGANLTISFAGELLQNAEELIRMGLHPSEIISGYNKAITKVPYCFFNWLWLVGLICCKNNWCSVFSLSRLLWFFRLLKS